MRQEWRASEVLYIMLYDIYVMYITGRAGQYRVQGQEYTIHACRKYLLSGAVRNNR